MKNKSLFIVMVAILIHSCIDQKPRTRVEQPIKINDARTKVLLNKEWKLNSSVFYEKKGNGFEREWTKNYSGNECSIYFQKDKTFRINDSVFGEWHVSKNRTLELIQDRESKKSVDICFNVNTRYYIDHCFENELTLKKFKMGTGNTILGYYKYFFRKPLPKKDSTEMETIEF